MKIFFFGASPESSLGVSSDGISWLAHFNTIVPMFRGINERAIESSLDFPYSAKSTTKRIGDVARGVNPLSVRRGDNVRRRKWIISVSTGA